MAVLKDASVAKGSLIIISKSDVSPAIIDKASSSVSVIVSGSFARDYSVGKTFNRLKNILKGIVFIFAPFRQTGTLHDVRQATKQSFGEKMATWSGTFLATSVFYRTCSAILNVLKSDKYHQKETYRVKTQRYSLKKERIC